jgi:hypothetical protein
MTVADATAETVAALEYPPEDPRAIIGLVALKLAEAFDENPTPALARELRQSLEFLTVAPNEPAGVVDELRARRLVRRVDGLIRSVGDIS